MMCGKHSKWALLDGDSMNKNGMSLVYVMIVIIIIGFLASALVRASNRSAISCVKYSKSENTRLAVKAGFQKALSQLETTDTLKQKEILSLLQKWNDVEPPNEISSEYRWLVGSATEYDSIENDFYFRTELLGFDINTHAVTLRSESTDGLGNKASALGVYILENLAVSIPSSGEIPTNALHIGSGSDQIFTNLEVYGDTYFLGNGKMLPHNVQPSNFYGTFRVDSRDGNPDDEFHIHSPKFHGPAYFNCNTRVKSHIDLKSKEDGYPVAFKSIGIEKMFEMEHLQLGTSDYYALSLDIRGGNLWLNGSMDYTFDETNHWFALNFEPNNLFDQGKMTYHKDAIFEDSHFENYTAKNLRNRKINIPLKLGITDTVPRFDMDVDILRPYAIAVNPGNWDGKKMTDLYNSSPKYKGEWLVLKYNGASGGLLPFKTGGEGFVGKVVWIVENKTIAEAGTTMYEHSDDGLSVFYVGENGSFVGLGGMEKFRGFIYSETNKNDVLFRTRPNSHYYGGIYIKENSGRFTLEGPPFDNHKYTSATDPAWIAYNKAASLTVHYDAEVMQEIVDIGILFPEGSDPIDSDDGTLIIKEGETNIETVLLSRSF